MGFDLKCIKCNMGGIFTINAGSQVGEIRVSGRREKMGKDKVEYMGQFLGIWENTENSGKPKK